MSLFHQKVEYQVAYVGYFTDTTRKMQTGSLNTFFDNGALSQKGNYLNGKKDGSWTSYRTTGLVSDEVLYNKGDAEKVTTFHDLPVIRQRAVTVDDMVNNIFQYILYDEQDQIIAEEKIEQTPVRVSTNRGLGIQIIGTSQISGSGNIKFYRFRFYKMKSQYPEAMVRGDTNHKLGKNGKC